MSADTANGTATAPSDYTALVAHGFTFGADSPTTQQLFPYTTLFRSVELTEAFQVVLSNLAASGRDVTFSPAGSTLTGTGTILNDDSRTNENTTELQSG